jgi:hypothetical protein
MPVSTEELISTEPVALAAPDSIEPPPPLTNGSLTPRMSASINEILFENADGSHYTVIGTLQAEGLIYLYLQNREAIYYAVSSDGSEWAFSPDPIFTDMYNNDFEYYPTSIQAIEDGFAIYCGASTVNYAEYDYLYSIWNLTAPDPVGPWTLDDYPALIGWHTGVEEAIPYYVVQPVVKPYLDGFRMYYAYTFTLEGINTPEFAIAHSWDGLVWRFTADLPTPGMSVGTYRLTYTQENDWTGLLILDVWPTESGWQMLYLLDNGESDSGPIYLGESEDGLLWAPSETVIQFPPELPTDSVVSASMLYFQDRYILTYCTMPESHQYQCFVAGSQ